MMPLVQQRCEVSTKLADMFNDASMHLLTVGCLSMHRDATSLGPSFGTGFGTLR